MVHGELVPLPAGCSGRCSNRHHVVAVVPTGNGIGVVVAVVKTAWGGAGERKKLPLPAEDGASTERLLQHLGNPYAFSGGSLRMKKIVTTENTEDTENTANTGNIEDRSAGRERHGL